MPKDQIRFSPLKGIDLSTGKIWMDKGAAQVSENMDYELPPGCRIRAGYARLLDSLSATVSVSGDPTFLRYFERDDEAVRLLIGYGTSIEEVTTGSTEWTG